MNAESGGPGLRERTFDYVVIGGGTAGCVLASRLSEDPRASVGLVEWGPSDALELRALDIGRYEEMLYGEYDLDYRSTPQARANSHVRQSRARILGGCSTHNGMIAFRPLPGDLDEWVALGAAGWDPETILPIYDRLRTKIVPVASEDRNPYLEDVIEAASTALGVPARVTWNDAPFLDGVGFVECGYDPATRLRSSSSVAYIHSQPHRPNLSLLIQSRALRVLLEHGRAAGVHIARADGEQEIVRARREIVLSAGAIDTPRLLLLSGIGPGDELLRAGVDVVHALPGVGRNLSDHVSALLVWEAAQPPGPQRVMDWDMSIAARIDPSARTPEVVMHVPLLTYADHAERLGYPTPERSLTMSPNVAKPRSRGRLWLHGPDPHEAPAIDYGYFTDAEGKDERTLLAGVRMARRIAETEPMARWIARETFPLVSGDTDEAELSEIVRAAASTVFHVCGTCRMGASDDADAVVDPQLRVRGVRGLSIADASVFPTVPAMNPVVTVLMVAERAAELIASWTSRTSGMAGVV